MIIAIDGPAGSGKSTTARLVADRLGYVYLDTGAMYRAVALSFLRNGYAPDEAGNVLQEFSLGIGYVDGTMHVYLNGEDVSAEIRTPEVGALVSQVSSLAEVREKLVGEQRRIARGHVKNHSGVVLDGRDIGTVVFPDADVKIFLVADAGTRARRRQAELLAQGRDAALESVYREITERDRIDSERALAPLRQAEDAFAFDTTDATIDEQVNFVIGKIRERQKNRSV